jgi:ribosomal protein L21E
MVMKNPYINCLFAIALLIAASCTKVIDLDLPQTDVRLVVEGIISNDAGPYLVKLTRTQKYSFVYDSASIIYEKGAMVIISDNAGSIDTMKEISTGIFQTHTGKISGQVGRSYHVDIFTSDGKHYKSQPEIMLAAPKIDSIYFDRDYSDVSSTDPNAYRYNVYIDLHEPAGELNYYMFVISYYWNYTWQEQYQYNFLMNDNLEDGHFYQKMKVASSYAEGYFTLKINMYALQKGNFDFWNIMFEQKSSNDFNGYVNNTVPLVGNIFNVNDPNDYAIGYFQVSGTSAATVYINR